MTGHLRSHFGQIKILMQILKFGILFQNTIFMGSLIVIIYLQKLRILIERELVKIINVLGQEVNIPIHSREVLFFIYNDGSVQKRIYF